MEIAVEVGKLTLADLRRSNVHRALLSANAKTSVSLNLPIGATCDPTKVCAQTCFGSGPSALTTRKSWLRRYHRNLRYLQIEETDRAAARLAREFRRMQKRWTNRGLRLDFLRINGIGDLVPELVAVINEFAAANPDVIVWVVTRRFDLAAQIAELPNVYLELSLDSSTPHSLVEQVHRLVWTHSRTYLAFLRTTPTDDTLGAAIVFNEKHTAGLPYHGTTDCPVDAGKLDLGNVRGVGGTACAKCRKCFGERVLLRQRQMLRATGAAPVARRFLPVVGQ